MGGVKGRRGVGWEGVGWGSVGWEKCRVEEV